MACCAWAWLSPFSPAIIMAAWAAAGLGERRSDCERRVVASRPGPGNWTMGWAMGGTTLGTIRLALLLTELAAEPLDLEEPGLEELIGGAWSCWTRLEARLLLEVLLVVEVRPPSLSSTVLRDFLFTVWIPPGLEPLIWTGRRLDMTGPGGLDITLVVVFGHDCWAMM